MTKQLFLLVTVLFACSGCAASHYTKEDSEATTIYLKLPEAKAVQLASSIDNYRPHDTRKNGQGFWEISIPLTPESTYFYIVDGAVYVPECRFREKDDFGSENCLYLP
ncbi:MAG: hypothetical protein ABFR63_00355 [Thermodesulfobacteriota bacterium]